MRQNQAAGEAAFVERSSGSLLRKVIKECLSFFTGQELEETQDRLQEDLRVAVFEACTGQKICTDHF